MDVEACNYNINATIDDGSCIYEGNPDCENISLINYSLKSKKLIKITDVLGREIKRDVNKTILFYIYDDGVIKKKIKNIK